ncbi:hypothetical protein D9756_000049 [Leucocoprinus leucothites]|uniref:Phytase n=1 Tax=Leucocoprinus leucothites TaxID=201217 RepID=A0A8H5GFF6_9AGAR|nr:hypothetical protein D9756_000049 [Leucoagaricus leucothites]
MASRTKLGEHFYPASPRLNQQYGNRDAEKAIYDASTTSEHLPGHEDGFDIAFLPTRTTPARDCPFKVRPWLLLPPALLLLLLYANLTRYNGEAHQPLPSQDSDYFDAGAPFAPYKTQKLWASYSPYYSVHEYQLPPQDCRLTQVNILQRHGARYPTLGKSALIAQALLRLQAAESYTDAQFEFIQKRLASLRRIPKAVLSSTPVPSSSIVVNAICTILSKTSESGRKSFVQYSGLADENNIPYVRASGSDRVIQSALKWIEGFSTGSGGTLNPPLALVIPEAEGYNNTLEDKSCPNAEHFDTPMQTWQDVYAQPIADRFNSIAQGIPENLTSEDAQSLITLCALETVAKEEYSQFCDLFTHSEFKDFEYALDLDKFYFTGYGSELGPVQGVGYVNELLARLTDQPVQDRTQTNRTLDSNPETFPLGRGIYVDLSHDNLMVAVFSAMGLFNNNEHMKGGMLDPARRDDSRDWVISRIVPFSGRMVVERMECDLRQAGQRTMGHGDPRSRIERNRRGQNGEDTVYVRVLVNDAVQNLEFCEGVDRDGLCPLRSFIRSQAYARENGRGDWERCFQ